MNLRTAIYNENVTAAVAEACVEAVLPPVAEDSPAGPVTISRAATPDDYVAEIHARISEFDGLTKTDVTPAAIAEILDADAKAAAEADTPAAQ